MRIKTARFIRVTAISSLVISAGFVATVAENANAATSPCVAPVTNPVACENTKTGTPQSTWDITGYGSATIQGFATQMSVNLGETETFKVDTPAKSYRLDIYRMGYYAGNGARLIASVTPSATLPQTQPSCLSNSSTGLVDCGNWAVSASWVVPTTVVSGIYFAKLVRTDGVTGASHVFFVVRDDSSHADLLYQTSDTTWQAYNQYGGNSLYVGMPDNRAYKVSYNRPFTTRGTGPEDFVFNAEYPMVRFLEQNGYNLSYFSGIDTDRRGALLKNHKAFLSVGHDEYWSGAQRANVEAARDAGVNLAFFSGNEVFWKTRWEASIDGSGTAYRTLVCYKETHANAVIDPQDPPTWTGTWRDPRFSPPADGGRPENALTGTIFKVNSGTVDIQVPAQYSALRFWRNTRVASLAAGSTATLASGTIGYEWDQDADNGSRPAGLIDLSSTHADGVQVLQDYGTNYDSGSADHHLTLYRAPSGALVFGAGSVQWSWGLDSHHDRGSGAVDVAMQQATVNLFADMGVQPLTLMSGLVAATASTDTTAPTAVITSPAAGTTVQVGLSTTISGTATDSGGGTVGGVEVSTDGGSTWHPATGHGTWTYTWTPGAVGSSTIEARATDDSANIGSPVARTVAVAARSCPCTVWGATVVPTVTADSDTAATEVGMKFRSDVAGQVTGIRFYKGTGNTGTHVGHLWSSTGTLLASVTFSGETSTGWQQANFSTPVSVAANTTYVVSYYAPSGHYAVDEAYFTNAAVDATPLHALQNGADGPNGLYTYASGGGSPTNSWDSSNYWVDVVLSTSGSSAGDTTPPTVTTQSPAADATGVPAGTAVAATFSEAVQATGITVAAADSGGATVSGSTAYNSTTRTVTFTPSGTLASGATYTVTVSGAKDLAGNQMVPSVWSFSTAAVVTPACPCSIWPAIVTPTVAADSDNAATEVGVKFRSDVAGKVTGIRFYKGTGNTGTHVGHLWSSTGTLLGTVTFSGESATGWQQALFATPVTIAPGTTYIASYYAPTGHYADDGGYFAEHGVDNGPLHALPDGGDGPNGIYHYGASGSAVPSDSWESSNYWVDVTFVLSS